MKYIDLKTVVESYKGFQDCMTNKSWGYLALLKGCNSSVRPSVPYEVDLNKVSNFLENIFNLSQTKKQYEGGHSLYVIFSNIWESFFNDQGKASPNIYDVIAWAYRREAFQDDITKEEIIKLFSEEFNIPSSVLSSSFNTKSKDIVFSDTLYSESELKTELSKIGVDISKNNIDSKKGGIVASPGEITRGPFIQPLYAAIDITDYVIILQSNYYSLYGNNEKNSGMKVLFPLQQIFYGAPGTGKSHCIKDLTKNSDNIVRTTFHPDSDYSTFVGAYKPTTKQVPMRDVTGKVIKENGQDVTEDRIIYEFVNQAFLQAYINAWKLYAESTEGEPEKQYLIIEEINRGNCAQIFGDLFQLLDRNYAGFSEYPIKVDADMKNQLVKAFKGLVIVNKEAINQYFNGKDVVEKVLRGEELVLPNNLYIWATMNTSDQSLFPIDSAFKRRWDWQYMPITDGKKGWKIEVNGKHYDWWQFLEKMNEQINTSTNSEDKKMGYFFCKAKDGIIDAKTFVGKVVFYVWNDVFKDFANEAGGLFIDEDGSLLSFSKFYTVGEDGKAVVVENKAELLLHNLGVDPIDEDDDLILDGKNKKVSRTRKAKVQDIIDLINSIGPELVSEDERFVKFKPGGRVPLVGKQEIVQGDLIDYSYNRYRSEQFELDDGYYFAVYALKDSDLEEIRELLSEYNK